jgi:hypothetical protein
LLPPGEHNDGSEDLSAFALSIERDDHSLGISDLDDQKISARVR